MYSNISNHTASNAQEFSGPHLIFSRNNTVVFVLNFDSETEYFLIFRSIFIFPELHPLADPCSTLINLTVQLFIVYIGILSFEVASKQLKDYIIHYTLVFLGFR